MADSTRQAEPKPNLGGRPEKVIDLDQLRRVCALHPTNAQIAAVFEVSERTIDRRIAEDVEFREIVERGRENSKLAQRQAYHAAVQRTISGSMQRGDASLVLRISAQPEARGGIGFTDKHEHDLGDQTRSWAELLMRAHGGGSEPEGEGEGDG